MRLSVTAILVFVCILITPTAFGQDSWNTLGVPVVETFTGYSGAGFQEIPGPGEFSSGTIESVGMSDGACPYFATCLSGDHARGIRSGGIGTGGFYAFEVETGPTNVAFGVQPGGSDFTPGSFTYRIANFAGNVTDVTLSYDIWVFNDQERAGSIKVSWAIDDGTYTALPSLDFFTPEVSDASPTWVKTTKTINIDLGENVDQERTFHARFTHDDESGTGSRDEFAIDNISTTPFSNLAAELTGFMIRMRT